MAVTTDSETNGSVTITTREGTVAAQKSAAGSTGDAVHVAGTVPVSETSVSTNVVILNPTGDDAVLNETDEGVSPLAADGLPIARLGQGVPDFGDE